MTELTAEKIEYIRTWAAGGNEPKPSGETGFGLSLVWPAGPVFMSDRTPVALNHVGLTIASLAEKLLEAGRECGRLMHKLNHQDKALTQLAERVRELEAENARLRESVARVQREMHRAGYKQAASMLNEILREELLG